jgi:hypothetical protein
MPGGIRDHLGEGGHLGFLIPRGQVVVECWVKHTFFFLVTVGFELRASYLLGRSLPLEPLCQPYLYYLIHSVEKK